MADARFHTTRWTMILSARDSDAPGTREAMADLCATYWYPLYAFVRRSGHTAEEALDLTQGYFLTMLEKETLEAVRPEAGKFRSFLLASMKHYLANRRREASAQKRGGGVPLLSLDGADAEDRYMREPEDARTPEQAYERRWALTILERTRERMRVEFDEAGKGKQFRLLDPYLTGDADARPYGQIAEELDTTVASIKMAVSRLRRRFGKLLREEIGRTVDDDQIDDEARYLLTVVRQ